MLSPRRRCLPALVGFKDLLRKRSRSQVECCDLYGAEFLTQYARLIQVRPCWWEYWQSFHFTHALLPNDYSLVPALEALGWKRLYRDETATLLARVNR